MSILDQQINVSRAMVNGRTIIGQKGEEWALKNLSPSQLRYSSRDSDLVSGYFPGGEELGKGRGPFMYPDNRKTFEGSDVVSNNMGIESIKDNKIPGKLG